MLKHVKEEIDISSLETEINEKNCISLSFGDNVNYEAYPHRLVYISGELNLIVEKLSDRGLHHFPVGIVESSHRIETPDEFQLNFSSCEIDDFLHEIQSLDDLQTRIILKVSSLALIDLTPKYQFLDNPYLTTNSNGEMIWAATVELTEDVYKWLYCNKDYIEIIDPKSVKAQFEHYCKIRLQKVS
jgi:hypothetical protein